MDLRTCLSSPWLVCSSPQWEVMELRWNVVHISTNCTANYLPLTMIPSYHEHCLQQGILGDEVLTQTQTYTLLNMAAGQSTSMTPNKQLPNIFSGFLPPSQLKGSDMIQTWPVCPSSPRLPHWKNQHWGTGVLLLSAVTPISFLLPKRLLSHFSWALNGIWRKICQLLRDLGQTCIFIYSLYSI